MNDLLPSCFEWLPILMGVACALAGFIVAKWAREPQAPTPAWRWGDAPRRPARDASGLLAHFIGAMLAAFAVSFAINHPLCG